jgi:hypothetical protein
VCRFNPMIKHRDMTRPVAVRKPVAVDEERETCPEGSPELGEISLRRGGKKLTTDLQMETVKMHQINCLVDDAIMHMLDM